MRPQDTLRIQNDSLVPAPQTWNPAPESTPPAWHNDTVMNLTGTTGKQLRLRYSLQDFCYRPLPEKPVLQTFGEVHATSTSHPVAREMPEPDGPRKEMIHPWTLPLILLILTLLTIINTLYINRIRPLFLALVSFRFSQTLSRERSLSKQQHIVLMNILYYLSASLFLYNTLTYFNITFWSLKGFTFYLSLLLLLVLAYFAKYLLNMFTGLVSSQLQMFKDYMFQVFRFNRIMGLLLSVLVILLPYLILIPVHAYLITGGIIISLTALLRVIRLYALFSSKGISIIYVILYLCALEMVPLWALVKVLGEIMR